MRGRQRYIVLVLFVSLMFVFSLLMVSAGGGGGKKCTESWSCGVWGYCVDGVQTRVCTDANNCGTSNNLPAVSQSCSPNFEKDLIILQNFGLSDEFVYIGLPAWPEYDVEDLVESASPITDNGHSFDAFAIAKYSAGSGRLVADVSVFDFTSILDLQDHIDFTDYTFVPLGDSYFWDAGTQEAFPREFGDNPSDSDGMVFYVSNNDGGQGTNFVYVYWYSSDKLIVVTLDTPNDESLIEMITSNGEFEDAYLGLMRAYFAKYPSSIEKGVLDTDAFPDCFLDEHCSSDDATCENHQCVGGSSGNDTEDTCTSLNENIVAHLNSVGSTSCGDDGHVYIYDVNQDTYVSPADSLMVVRRINSGITDCTDLIDEAVPCEGGENCRYDAVDGSNIGNVFEESFEDCRAKWFDFGKERPGSRVYYDDELILVYGDANSCMVTWDEDTLVGIGIEFEDNYGSCEGGSLGGRKYVCEGYLGTPVNGEYTNELGCPVICDSNNDCVEGGICMSNCPTCTEKYCTPFSECSNYGLEDSCTLVSEWCSWVDGACVSANGTIEDSCHDSDGGVNLYKKGTATGLNGEYTESCAYEDESGVFNYNRNSGTFLKEYYCDSDGNVEDYMLSSMINGYASESGYSGYVLCDYGCVDGACVEPPMSTYIREIKLDADGEGVYMFDGGSNSGRTLVFVELFDVAGDLAQVEITSPDRVEYDVMMPEGFIFDGTEFYSEPNVGYNDVDASNFVLKAADIMGSNSVLFYTNYFVCDHSVIISEGEKLTLYEQYSDDKISVEIAGIDSDWVEFGFEYSDGSYEVTDKLNDLSAYEIAGDYHIGLLENLYTSRDTGISKAELCVPASLRLTDDPTPPQPSTCQYDYQCGDGVNLYCSDYPGDEDYLCMDKTDYRCEDGVCVSQGGWGSCRECIEGCSSKSCNPLPFGDRGFDSCGDLTSFIKNPTSFTQDGNIWILEYVGNYTGTDYAQGDEYNYNYFYAAFDYRQELPYDQHNGYHYVNYELYQFESGVDVVQSYLDRLVNNNICSLYEGYVDYIDGQDVKDVFYVCDNSLMWDFNEEDYDSHYRNGNVEIYWINGLNLIRFYNYYSYSPSYYYDWEYERYLEDYEKVLYHMERDHEQLAIGQNKILTHLESMMNNEPTYVSPMGAYYDMHWVAESLFREDILTCPSDLMKTDDDCNPSYQCTLEPAVCPPHGEQTRRCVDVNECSDVEKEYEVDCNPGICSGCMMVKSFRPWDQMNSKCMPYAARFEYSLLEGHEERLNGGVEEEGDSVITVEVLDDWRAKMHVSVPDMDIDETVYMYENDEANFVYMAKMTGEPFTMYVKEIVYDTSMEGNGYVIFEGIDNYNAYCDYDREIKPQKERLPNGDWAVCQNNFECESNFCSTGECIEIQDMLSEVGGMKEIGVKVLCRFADMFGVQRYDRCILENLGEGT